MFTRARPSAVCLRPRSAPASCRWGSYDRSKLTIEELQKEVEGGLANDVTGTPMRIDPDAKTVSTAAGDLPISPVFSPKWIQGRRRAKKSDPVAPTGRFRRKLIRNPFARALATPFRICVLTNAGLPKYFLQDFDIVAHPETGEPRYVPGSASFHRIQPKSWKREEKDAESTDEPRQSPNEKKSTLSGAQEESPPTEQTQSRETERRGPGTVTIYVHSSHALLNAVGMERAVLQRKILGARTGSAVYGNHRMAEWAANTHEVLLKMLRRTAVDALVARAERSAEPLDKYVEPVKEWKDSGSVKRRGCVLWLPDATVQGPETGADSTRYATIDVPDTSYDRKMPVHNLRWLLGDEECARLKSEAPRIFGQGEVFVLKTWKTHSMVNLHLLLWRLQGFLNGDLTRDTSTE